MKKPIVSSILLILIFTVITFMLVSCDVQQDKNESTPPASKEWFISTFAGIGSGGYTGDGGAATSAEFYNPNGVAVDSSGNVYIADMNNHVIRKVDTSGTISTIAGTGSTSGYSGDGGAATSAKLNKPSGVYVDSAGNVYFADSSNHVIRKVDTSGKISTIAGTGANGYTGDGGLATSAKLDRPYGVAVNSSGVYIADQNNSVIRKVDTSGNISTIAGTGASGYTGDGGAATSAKISYPATVAVDSTGNVYIAEYENNVIRKVDTSGNISTIAGTGASGYTGDGGLATSAKLNHPSGVVVDSGGNVFIADTSNHVIRKVDTSGNISTIAGKGTAEYSGDGGVATSAELHNPSEIDFDSTGNMYIADSLNHAVRKLILK